MTEDGQKNRGVAVVIKKIGTAAKRSPLSASPSLERSFKSRGTAARTFFQIPRYGSIKVPASGCACAGMTKKEWYVGHILEERLC